MSKRPSSTALRRQVFDACKYPDPVTGRIMMTCHLCSLPIDPAREKWDAEHVIPFANGGTEIRPAHTACHKPKTARDASEIAKGKRIRDYHFGIKRRGSSFPGNRNSKWKKKLNGTVERRD